MSGMAMNAITIGVTAAPVDSAERANGAAASSPSRRRIVKVAAFLHPATQASDFAGHAYSTEGKIRARTTSPWPQWITAA